MRIVENASRILARLTPSLRESVTILAQAEDTSVDDLLVIAIVEKLARAEHSAWLVNQRVRMGAAIATRRAGIESVPRYSEEQVERNRLADVFEDAPVFFAVLSGPEHVFDLVNQSYLELVGDRVLLGKPIVNGLPELAGTVWIDRLNRVYRTGEPLVQRGARVTLAPATGKPLEDKYVDYAYKARRAADGTISGITVLGVDTSLVHAS